MKNRKNLGCRIKDPKERGAWAELYFMALAASQGLKVSSPYGGFASYDVGVEDSGPILRVQVKCTMRRHPKGGFSLNIRGPKYRGYPRGTVDFFALYIIPTDDWYIIPYALIGERYATIHFTPEGERQKYGRYHEAWHRLLQAARSRQNKALNKLNKKNGHNQGRSNKALEIRACCEDAGIAAKPIASDIRGAKSEAVIRKMFQDFFAVERSDDDVSPKARQREI